MAHAIHNIRLCHVDDDAQSGYITPPATPRVTRCPGAPIKPRLTIPEPTEKVFMEVPGTPRVRRNLPTKVFDDTYYALMRLSAETARR